MKGWLFEQRVSDKFEREHDGSDGTLYIPGQWFQYQEHGQRLTFCQTDGLLFRYRQQRVLIIEVKYKHTVDAYWQLEQKYVPVVSWLFRNWEISTCEVVKWYDAATPFPTEVSLKKEPLTTKPSEFGVHILNI